MIKVDLHTHSIASPDGGLTLKHYQQAIKSKQLDVIAITDHNRIDFAIDAKKQMPSSIIIGEEIMTTRGEIIGLYLKEAIPAGLTPEKAIQAIKRQNGIVYIPHPFETIRKGLSPAILDKLVDDVDIIEIRNGRAFFQNMSKQAVAWMQVNGKVGAASSDAHGPKGLGHTYTQLSAIPAKATLVTLLSSGIVIAGRPSVPALIYPKMNRLLKKVKSHGVSK